MSATMRPLAEVNERATAILVRELGVVDALRFLNQVRGGSGNYTEERGQWLDDLSLAQISSAMKTKKPKRSRTSR